jgi:hypothetical protein
VGGSTSREASFHWMGGHYLVTPSLYRVHLRKRATRLIALPSVVGIVSTAVALTFAWSPAAVAANTTYAVNQTILGGGVAGSIVTDGTTGVLTQANIVSWNLNLNGVGATQNLTSVGAQSGVGIVGLDLTATASSLTFNYSAADGGYIAFQAISPGPGSGAKYWCNNTNWFGCAHGASVVPILFSDPSSQYDTSLAGSLAIAGGAGGGGGGSIATSVLLPLMGGPQSLQASLIDQSFDPQTLGGLDYDEPANFVGASYGRSSIVGDGQRYDASYQHGFRVLSGNRALLIIRLPITYYQRPGGHQLRLVGAVSLEYPITPQWTVQPTMSFGGFNSDSHGLSGQMTSVAVASEYTIYNHFLGRGKLTLGNMLGYTKTTVFKLGGAALTRPAGSLVSRDGLAYELPLTSQLDGHAASLRASYTYTYAAGDQLQVNKTHDLVVSMGVRTRDAGLRNTFELLRFGIRGELDAQSHAAYIFGGFRF